MIRIEITNDGSGTPEHGNYDVRVVLPSPRAVTGWAVHEARVEGFDRLRGWEELAHEAISAFRTDSPDG